MVSKVEEGLKYSSLRSSQGGKTNVRAFTMKVFTQMQRCHLGVSQSDRRRSGQSGEYALLRMMVAKLEISAD